MRFWTLLMNHEPGERIRYVAHLLALFEDVDVSRIRRGDLPYATLLQADVELAPARRDLPPQTEPLARHAVYSGWMRDPCRDRVYSSLHDDDLVIDPLGPAVIGEFSYAVLSNGKATIATDHYATHPVYYHRGRDGRWIVSNDLRLVLASPNVPVQIDRSACGRFLTSEVMVDENELADGTTFFTSISKLEPGSVLTIDAGGLTHRIVLRNASPIARGARRERPVTREECVEAFKEQFGRCVRDRLAAGARGLLLSGGIDSASVLGACLASGAAAPFSVSVAFKDPELVMSHDGKLLSLLYGSYSLPHEVLHADKILRLPTLEDPGAYVDGPDSAANPLVKEACAAALQRRGISMTMTGEGGDVVLGEAMHELVLDGLRESEGIAGVHRYLTRQLGVRCGSASYWRRLVESVIPSLGHRALLRQMRNARRVPLPAFLRPAIAEVNHSGHCLDRREERYGIRAGNSASAREKRRFAYIGHRYVEGMLFPRASYFDALNVQCVQSHPFLDPRMIAFALTCPPHLHHDYFNLDRTNPYASAKMLARIAYRRELPAAVMQKTHKTSYALMARRMFHNSGSTLYALTDQAMVLADWALVDQKEFRRQLMAYIVAMEDPNANPGIHYHYMRGVCDLEIWLRRFLGPRARIETHLKLRPARRLL